MQTSLKNRFPYRLGTSSYIIPADVLPNVRYLADKVDDIELVLFESDEISNIPDENAVKELKSIADDNNLTFTVHLPLDSYTGSADESVRKSSVEKCLRIIDRMQSLNPFAYVKHLHGDCRGLVPTDDLPRWQANHDKSIQEILKAVPPRMLCIETLDYPFSLVEEIVTGYDLAVTLDIGHIILYSHSMDDYLDKYLSRTRVLHLHGIIDGDDHKDISNFDDVTLKKLLDRLKAESDTERVLTMEIFGEQDFNASMEVMRRYAD